MAQTWPWAHELEKTLEIGLASSLPRWRQRSRNSILTGREFYVWSGSLWQEAQKVPAGEAWGSLQSARDPTAPRINSPSQARVRSRPTIFHPPSGLYHPTPHSCCRQTQTSSTARPYLRLSTTQSTVSLNSLFRSPLPAISPTHMAGSLVRILQALELTEPSGLNPRPWIQQPPRAYGNGDAGFPSSGMSPCFCRLQKFPSDNLVPRTNSSASTWHGRHLCMGEPRLTGLCTTGPPSTHRKLVTRHVHSFFYFLPSSFLLPPFQSLENLAADCWLPWPKSRTSTPRQQAGLQPAIASRRLQQDHAPERPQSLQLGSSTIPAWRKRPSGAEFCLPQRHLLSVVSAGDQQSCQQPGSCTKGSLSESGLGAEAKQRKDFDLKASTNVETAS